MQIPTEMLSQKDWSSDVTNNGLRSLNAITPERSSRGFSRTRSVRLAFAPLPHSDALLRIAASSVGYPKYQPDSYFKIAPETTSHSCIFVQFN